MNTETKTCRNCKNQFTIEAEDFAFYERIHVPPPTWCPECRMARKLAWRMTGLRLHKRKCEAPGHSEEILTRYTPAARVRIYDHKYWWSDAWDPMDYGRDYDFSRPFFKQFDDMVDAVPVRNLEIINSINCDYCPSAIDSKDCYMVAGGYLSEECMYSDTPAASRRAVDSHICIFCDTLYECFACEKCFDLFFGYNCSECINSRFLYNCHNCADCFGCVNLRNKKYHIFNKPYSKDDYRREVAKFDTGSHRQTRELLDRFWSMVKKYPRKYADIRNSVDCTGDVIANAKNCKHAFQIRDGAEDCKYLFLCGRNIKDSYDVFAGGARSEILYESATTLSSQRIFFSDRIHNSMDIYCSRECQDSSDLFACIGLRNKQYCILNKQYTKDGYKKLVPRIIEHMNSMPYMDKRGREYKYGEFFPPELSRFGYNLSFAHEIFPLTQEKALALGYVWEDKHADSRSGDLSLENLPDNIDRVGDDILQKTISCAHSATCNHPCTGIFRLIPAELEFYREKKLPLPRLCPNCRQSERAALQNPWKLWRRKCMCAGHADETGVYKNQAKHSHSENHCPNGFQTPYAPERVEIIYCESCYNNEIA